MTIRPIVWTSCLSLILLTGCMKVGPDFQRPQTKSPEAWLEAEKGVSRPDLPIHDTWWTALNDPVLDGLLDKARSQNILLHTAAVRILEARAQLGSSVGQLYPQTQQAVGAYQFQQVSQTSPTAPQPAKQSGTQWAYWQNSVGFQAAWELDFWGKYRRGVEAAAAQLAASVAEYDNALVSLEANVASTYVTLRVAEARLRIAQDNAALEREGLKIANIRFTLGATSERDVEQAKSLLASTEATIPQFTAAIQKAKHALCVLLGLPPSNLDELLAATGRIPACPNELGVGIPADLLRRRPDIRKAEYAAAAQCASIGVAKAELFPSFSLTGNVGWLSSNVGAFSLADILAAKTFTAGVSPGFTWSLFNYGRILDNVRAQDARFQQALLTYRNTVLTALKEVEDSLSDFQQTRLQAVKLTEGVEAATRSAQLAFYEYQEGKTDFTTVIVAQRDQLSQQDSLAQAQGNIALGMIGLYRALGGGWELRQGQAVVPADIKEEMARRTNWGRLLNETPDRQADPSTSSPERYIPDF